MRPLCGRPVRERIASGREGSVLIRFHIGDGWSNGGALPAESRGTLGIEVDGVDIARGRLEDRVVPAIAALVEATARLAEGQARTAAVAFDDGAIELILARHGDRVALSLVSLPRPARVLVRDLEVDLDALARAAAGCAREVLARLRDLGAADAPAARRLARAGGQLARAAAMPGAALPAGAPVALRSRPARAHAAPAIGFDLRDDDGRIAAYAGGEGLHALLAPGHVHVHAPDGEELCTVAGAPFLLLRDLADLGLRLLEAVRDDPDGVFVLPLAFDGPALEIDLRGGACTVAGRTLRCAPEAVARALFAGALDLGGALLARNPRLADNPWLASLIAEARERIALCDQLAAPARASVPAAVPVEARAPRPRPAPEDPPLAPGRLRRVSLRLAWRAQVQRIRRLHPTGRAVWAIDSAGATRIALGDGAATPPCPGAVAIAGPKEPLLVASGGEVALLAPGGRERWRAPLGLDRLNERWIALPGGRGAASEGAHLVVFDRSTGAPIASLEPPAAHRLRLAAAGEVLLVGADNGLLYGLHAATGAIAWRVPVGHPVERISVLGDRLLVELDGAVAGYDAASGEALFRTRLPIAPAARILPVPGGWVIAGTSRVGGELVCLGADGRVRWEARPNLGARAPSLLRVAGALFARGEDGVCRIERGRVRWNVPCAPGGEPVLVRGLLALPGERLEVLDAASGARLLLAGSVDRLPPADHLLAVEDGLLVADGEGEIARVRLAGALAVVR